MIYSAQFVADYFLSHTKTPLTVMHMIKMTYIAHGYTLAITNLPLITARIEAWKYGPVIPVLYQTYKGYASEPIITLNYCGTAKNTKAFLSRKTFIRARADKTVRNILDKIVEHFSCLSGGDLSALTHAKGTPWHQCYKRGRMFTLIPNHVIQRYYVQKLKNNDRTGY